MIAPAQGAIEYDTKVFYKSFGDDLSPYQGWPDDEKDKLWDALYASKCGGSESTNNN